MAEDADSVFFKKLFGMVPAHFNIQEEEQEADTEMEPEPEPVPKKKRKQQKSDCGGRQGDTVSAREEKIQGKKESKQKKKKQKEKTGSRVSVQEAQEKLRARIAELQAKRAQSLTGAETQERKRLERKQRRLHVKGKQKNKKKGGGDPKENGTEVTEPIVVKKATKPICTEDGKLVFSKFDFTRSGEKEKGSDLVGKDFKRILARLEHRETKVAKLREKDSEAATSLEQKYIWQNVMAKAKGEKIKDDVSKVKKAVQRKEKTKEKRKKKWDSRTATEEKFIKQRQEKRQENIQKRKDEKKAKHRKKMIKKGRILPGF